MSVDCPHCGSALKARLGQPMWDDELHHVNQDSLCGTCGATMRLLFSLEDVSQMTDPTKTLKWTAKPKDSAWATAALKRRGQLKGGA